MLKKMSTPLIVLAAGLFFWGCNNGSNPTSAATPKWIGTWDGAQSTDTLGSAVTTYMKIAFNIDLTCRDSMCTHIITAGNTSSTLIVTAQGAWRDIGNNRLETTSTACTLNDFSTACSGKKDTLDASGINGNTWTTSYQGVSYVLTRK
jgi:hypothetical protein